jgi:flagellar hook-basal body complex protein FliE
MRVETLVPDVTPAQRASGNPDANAFSKILDGLGSVLGKAEGAEDAFAAGTGDLQTAVYERARADVALSVATAAAQRTAQALQSILNMQV